MTPMSEQRPESLPQSVRSAYELMSGLTDRYRSGRVDEEFPTLRRRAP